ncbi:peptidoglycan DD-metalloendopeptidase family protein [Seohaeicola zhoushanensis]|uniref:Peptidase M23 n=1 Tax=Seohaeicola zhoushanensis TaxID=1569283 RepID=A0A8J3M8D8_9RHOB|nr:peptidoglycan DD-metalloendopeptidase family protein [Seohaeicola zhoushanensis]GHF41709.1 peptidase M23 [Seohaeicola zhoushanensis]
MRFCQVRFPARLMAGVASLALLAACDEPLDFDMRGKVGGFSTAPAAQSAAQNRPAPDGRGIISYPNYQVAVARRGDTVSSVANRIGLTPADLARYNGLTPGDELREGEVLALPRRVAESSAGGVDISAIAGSAIDASPRSAPAAVTTTSLPPSGSAAAAPATAAPKSEPVRHKVVRGETAYTVSRLYQVSVKDLADWNGLGPDFSIREGQYLLIPVKGATPPKVAPAVVTKPGAGSETPVPPSAAKPLPNEKIAAKPPAAPAVSVGQPSRDPQASAAMAYPVNGKIIRTYTKGKNDGIDIAAAPGTAVTAAADGTVRAITASADKVAIVVIQHPNNLLTVYANVDGIAVKKGDSVKRGQKLAQLRAGENAYVHFEVRKGFDSQDPTPYLN